MAAALRLARRSLGMTWPNPAVGCIVVKDGRVVGRGWTALGGRPHAETQALAMAKDAARGADVYVTLEPCSHHGKTPPCAEALIKAGVSRVVIAATDPDPRVNGQGVKMLKDAKIAVEVGLMAAEATDLNAGFFHRIKNGRPLVTVKIASSADGRVATHKGESQWISGNLSRARTHLLRAETDAVLIGSGTGLADNPELTCRLPGLSSRSPLRILVDSRLRVPLTSKLVATAKKIPTWIFTRADADKDRAEVLKNSGVEVIVSEVGPDGRINLAEMFQELGRRGLTNILVEPGGHLLAALFQKKLVDRMVWVHSPMVLGGDGLAAVLPFGVDFLRQAPKFQRIETKLYGDDVYEFMTRE